MKYMKAKAETVRFDQYELFMQMSPEEYARAMAALEAAGYATCGHVRIVNNRVYCTEVNTEWDPTYCTTVDLWVPLK